MLTPNVKSRDVLHFCWCLNPTVTSDVSYLWVQLTVGALAVGQNSSEELYRHSSVVLLKPVT